MKRDSATTYVIAAGGTGGHIFPGLALAGEIVAQRPQAQVVFIGTGEGLEARLVPAAGFPLETVRASGFSGKSLADRIRSLARLPFSVREARRLLRKLDPGAVVGLGAYVSVPVILAARSLSIPTLIHESNALPGVANRLLSRVATRTAVGFEAARRRFSARVMVTGTPVRKEFFAAPPPETGGARPRRLLAFGGSQGSAALNRAMVEAAPLLAGEGFEVVHQTGEKWLDSVRQAYGKLPEGWRLEPFLPRLFDSMGRCDLVICRAGAMTLAELGAAGRPAILVPLASSTHGHQLANARAVAESGAAVVLEERELSGRALAQAVQDLFAAPDRLERMAEQARRLGKADAAAHLVGLLFEIERRAA